MFHCRLVACLDTRTCCVLEAFCDAERPCGDLCWAVQGEQVFISYGTHGNDSLLQYFGFVERDNPHDRYTIPDISQSDPAVARAYGLLEGQKAKWQQVCCLLSP